MGHCIVLQLNRNDIWIDSFQRLDVRNCVDKCLSYFSEQTYISQKGTDGI